MKPFKTIQQALDASNTWGDSIWIEAGTYSITSELRPPNDNNGITIRSVSGDPADVTIDAQGLCRCFNGSAGYNHYFKGITFANGAATGNGGAAFVGNNSWFEDCVFRNCTATSQGGAIRAAAFGHATNVRIENCTAGASGGGLYSYSGGYLSGVVVSNCVAGTDGGGVYCYGGDYGTTGAYYFENLEIRDCRTLAGHGGGLYAYGRPNNWATNVTIAGCVATKGADVYGGGAHLRFVNMSQSTVTNCHAVETSTANYVKCVGGGAYLYNSTLSNSTVTACSVGSGGATRYLGDARGGGIDVQYAADGKIVIVPQIVGCAVRGCWATNEVAATGSGPCGGGVSAGISSGTGILIRDCDISGNFANSCGGGVFAASGTAVENCTVTNNSCRPTVLSASAGGSGIRLSGTLGGRIDGCLVQGNAFENDCSDYNGGGSAVWLVANSSLLNSAIIGNSGSRSVGLQWASCGGILVSNCLFKSNIARLTGGSGRGGILSLYGLNADSLITDCRFIDNQAASHGGFVEMTLNGGSSDSTLRIRNCLISGNSQSAGNGLVWANSSTSATARRLALENCTIVSNTIPNAPVICPYIENANYTATNFFSVSGCAILFNNGKAAFANNFNASANVTYNCTEMSGMSESNIKYDSSKPLFEDLVNGDYRPAEGSQLLNAVPAADWMGKWSMRSTSRDLGTGYELQSAGTYGVNVVWTDTMPRLSGRAADIGCFERWEQPGFIFSIR